jgi:hypothetical protein
MSREAALRAWLLQEAGDISWCRQVSGSSFVTGSWHQTEADLATNPVGYILPCFPAQKEELTPFHASWCPRSGDMAVLLQTLSNRHSALRL